jgi:PhnB protein
MPPQPIPEGYHSINGALTVSDGAAAIEYYKKAFGAKDRFVMNGPDGKVAHAELEIGDSVFMLSDPFPQGSTKPPTELGGSSASLMLYVDDVDSVVQSAVDEGATIAMPVEDQFWGDRFGTIIDPFGHVWSVATHVEDVPPEEMEERAKVAMAAMAGS